MRANLADFNVTIHEEYDPAIPEMMVIPQDLSRAVINVMNNACYAVWKRQKASGDDYSPVITVKAILKGDNFEIWIEDNGTGMSEEVREHLFTAFFTTKPVGEGTGLGLSITREIIEDKHHGKIEVESEENKFTRFVFIIPVKR